MTVLDTIMAALQGAGLTPAQAAGVAGNLTVESGLDPTRQNAAEGAVGLAQWEGGRRVGLDNYAATTGGSETDLQTQVNYLIAELQGPESGALQHLQATSTPGDAAAAFDQYYERSAGTTRTQRVQAADAIAAGDQVGGSTSSTSSSGGGGLFGGIFSGWQNDLAKIGLKVTAAAAAAGLVIVGATHTVSN